MARNFSVKYAAKVSFCCGAKQKRRGFFVRVFFCSLGRVRHGWGGDVADDDLDGKGISEENAVQVCHLPGAFDDAGDSAGYDEFNGEFTLRAGGDGFCQRDRVSAHGVAANVTEGEAGSPGTAADVLHFPCFCESFSCFETCSIGDGDIFNIEQVEARVGRECRFGCA